MTPTSDAWIPDYLKTVTSLVAKHGGKYLARTLSHERLEWPSKEAAEGFYRDPAYQPSLRARLEGAVNELFLIEGKDDFASS